MRKVNSVGIVGDYGSLPDLTTTLNTFVDVGVLESLLMRTKHFAFVGADNTLSVKILGSIDGGTTYPFEEVAAFDVAAGATVVKSFTTFYTNVKVQVQPKVAATHGTLSTRWGMASY